MSNTSKFILSPTGARDRFVAVILLLPAVLAALVLQYDPPPIIDLFVRGGHSIFVYNLCILMLTPYFVLFLLALGNLYLSRFPIEDLFPLKRADLRLISFFVGCGILTIFGFILALLKLLYFWICFPIFVVILYFYFLQPRSKETVSDLWDWIKVEESTGPFRFVLLILRGVLIFVIVSIILSKGILPELFKDGGLHQYFAYFVETRLYHSIWMDPSHPVLYDYLAGRGQGVLLFFTSFTNQFTIQIIGTFYLIAIGMIARQVIVLLLSVLGKTEDRASLRSCLPDLVMLLVLTSPILDMETARFHLQTGAFFLFLCWVGSLFLILEKGKDYWLFLALIPVVVAFPIADGIFYAFICWIFGMIIVSLLLTRNTTSLKYPLFLLGFGAVSAIFSFSLNWLYVGIPELQPSSIFIPLVWMERFQHWSSTGLIYYLDSSLGQTVSSSRLSIYNIGANVLALFSYPLVVLAKQISIPQLLLSSYSILVAVIFVWVVIGRLRNLDSKEKSKHLSHKIFIYWLTFTSFYILKLLLTSFVQQASLKRMLLFMDVIPIVTFFSMTIFLVHWAENRSLNTELKTQKSPGEKLVVFFDRNKGNVIIAMSILWGGCLSLTLVNLWPYFGRRSFPIQFLLFSLLLTGGGSLFFLSLKRISRYYGKESKNKKLRLMVNLLSVGLFLMILLFPFTPLSSNIPVPHTLKISAMGDKNSLSSSSDVKLFRIVVDDQPVEFKSLEESGDWIREKGALQSTGPAALIYVFTGAWDSVVEIPFAYGPSAGLVQVEYDDQKPVVKDLYDSKVGLAGFLPPPSLFENKTSLLLAIFLFVVEYIVILGLILNLFTLFPSQQVDVGTFLLFALTLAFIQFQSNLGFVKINGSWQFFTGREGAIKAYGPVITYGRRAGDRSDVLQCLEILKKVPGPAPVLNINGFAAMEPCLFSPLLPRDKIVHHYEAVAITEPYYQTLMFGEPQAAYKIYRDLGINYFYLRKDDAAFVNLGYSRALEPQNLEQYFDIYAEADDFYILTWRGEGLYPVSSQLAQQIEVWYNEAKDKKYNPLAFWWLGRDRLEDWVQTQP